jgi:hypothetical protein
MALIKADIATVVKTNFDAQFGPSHPDFTAERQKFADAIADILIDVLLTKLDITGQTNVLSGSSAGSYPTTITKV